MVADQPAGASCGIFDGKVVGGSVVLDSVDAYVQNGCLVFADARCQYLSVVPLSTLGAAAHSAHNAVVDARCRAWCGSMCIDGRWDIYSFRAQTPHKRKIFQLHVQLTTLRLRLRPRRRRGTSDRDAQQGRPMEGRRQTRCPSPPSSAFSVVVSACSSVVSLQVCSAPPRSCVASAHSSYNTNNMPPFNGARGRRALPGPPPRWSARPTMGAPWPP